MGHGPSPCWQRAHRDILPSSSAPRADAVSRSSATISDACFLLKSALSPSHHSLLPPHPPFPVSKFRCTGCPNTLLYDGREDGLLALNANYCCSEDLLDDFLTAFFCGIGTLTAFANTQQVFYERAYGTTDTRSSFTRARLGAFLRGYHSLLDWSTLDSTCSQCGDNPRHVVCDAIMQGIQAKFWNKLPKDPRDVVKSVTVVGRAAEDVYFIPPGHLTKRMYKLLLGFVRAPPARPCRFGEMIPIVTSTDPAVTQAETNELLEFFDASTHPRLEALHPFLVKAVEFAVVIPGVNGGADTLACDPALAQALYPLVTHSVAFASHKPDTVAEVMKELLGADSVCATGGLEQRIKSTFPWMTSFLRDMGLDALPDYTRAAMKAVVGFAEYLATWEQKYILTAPGQSKQPKTLSQLHGGNGIEKAAACDIERANDWMAADFEEDMNAGGFYAPFLRTRRCGTFEYVKTIESDKGRGCIKAAPSTRTHSPGIFSALCPHGHVCALILLRSAESPFHAFDLFHSRFRTLPHTIVYDNACNLDRYCAAREPGVFSTVRVLVDRLHWANHVRCTTAHRMSEWSDDVEIRSMDSQRAEQWNKMLTRISTHIAFSTPRHAMDALRALAAKAAKFRERAALHARGAHAAPVPAAAAANDAADDDDIEELIDEVDDEMNAAVDGDLGAGGS